MMEALPWHLESPAEPILISTENPDELNQILISHLLIEETNNNRIHYVRWNTILNIPSKHLQLYESLNHQNDERHRVLLSTTQNIQSKSTLLTDSYPYIGWIWADVLCLNQNVFLHNQIQNGPKEFTFYWHVIISKIMHTQSSLNYRPFNHFAQINNILKVQRRGKACHTQKKMCGGEKHACS